jgi:hypothetical protein
MKKKRCRNKFEKKEDKKKKKGKASGFFCEIDEFSIKYGLFTNNHVFK